MSAWLWRIVKRALFLFDAEKVHDVTHWTLRLLGRRRTTRKLLEIVSQAPERLKLTPAPLAGLVFRNPIGLAAGFDKNAELLHALPSFGFGFAEIGTVTPLPQPGNPKPRLFRDPAAGNLFNLMGFNGAGATAVAANLTRVRQQSSLPLNFRIGVNLGKMKQTEAVDAARDYALAAAPFEYLADYLVVNVSSPNTPGLRDLQNSRALTEIVDSVRAVTGNWRVTPPLFLKLAPELDEAALESLIPSVEKAGVDGWILTNTWGGEHREGNHSYRGGWSGKILTDISFLRLKAARSLTTKPIISVGGIMSVDEAKRRRQAGADLLQIYSGWVFEGPGFPSTLVRAFQSRE